MLGHAGANMVPVVASNRIGTETFGESSITFYGGSFISDPTGNVVAQVGAKKGVLVDGNPDPKPDRNVEGVVTATFDLEENRKKRAGWGMFRDRRPDLYAPVLCTLDGATNQR
jgi:N-carbamoylputrescine amidase